MPSAIVLIHGLGRTPRSMLPLARAAVPGMRDFLVVPHSHTFLMRAPAVIAQALHFLEHGTFLRT